MSTKTPQQLREHAHQIAKAFNVLLNEVEGMRMEDAALVHYVNGPKVIMMPPIRDEVTYAIVMHELGHAIHPAGLLRTAKHLTEPCSAALKLDEELAAWEWAEHYALDWTAAMEHTRLIATQTYQQSVLRERAVSAQTTAWAKSVVGDLLRKRGPR